MKLILILITMLLVNISYAHDSHTTGFVSGLTHPILGFDHFLAMFSVGVLSTLIGGRAIWVIPMAFVVVMVVGGIFGMMSIDEFPAIEIGIAGSVIALGLAIFIGDKLPIIIGIIFVGFFAVFHGFAHGEEMPYSATPILYAIGFVISTTAIHIAGLFMGNFSKKYNNGMKYLRYSGLAISAMGVWLLFV